MSTKDEAERKIGEGHAAAMARLGLKELRGAFYPQSNVAQPSEYGLYGTRTPGEIADDRRPDGDEEKSVLADRLQQAEVRDDRARDSKSLERE
ncbi:MAG: hypothetical protein ACK5Q8_04685 [Phycisphaerales bacterium]|jgi:hypothetical protein